MFENEEYSRVIPFNNGKEKTELTIYQETITDVGGVIWDSALMTIHYFFKNPEQFHGKKILELGSGTGVCGIALAALGAEVIITDLPERIPLIQKNVAANSRLTSNRIQVQVLDWTKDKIPDGLDLVLAVDCVYYNSTITPLINLLKTCDAKETIIVSEERDIGEASVAQKTFFKNINEFFELTPISHEYLDPDYCAEDIIIGRLIKKP
ncbi:hypothetical protein GCK72_014276 [Caenorhabditis remanei]|uniref:Uncharacterized protein n=1 Tax=Caenorhabditis remanei TaxID=31234 RepID=A0A6A5GTJ6_CAERE|nr:hypothetical protein GCK72_014276 [Caenorhabditis remanei]KAF1757819.1 hypothetical protein GCK72_014276 [Caenorhabditis remanei]